MSVTRSEVAGPKGNRIRVLRILTRSGILAAARPDRTVRQLTIVARWGATVPGGHRAAAACSPKRIAGIDERRQVPFGELHRRAVRLGHGLGALGVAPGSRGRVPSRHVGRAVALLVAW